jgi:hypothetical protein
LRVDFRHGRVDGVFGYRSLENQDEGVENVGEFVGGFPDLLCIFIRIRGYEKVGEREIIGCRMGGTYVWF